VSATRFRSAWADPEHVRLAMFRSWWDQGTGPALRGPLVPREDPWSADPHRARRATGGTR
jgi:hypothetical protein